MSMKVALIFLFQKSLYSFRDLKEMFAINHLKCWSLVREEQIEAGKTTVWKDCTADATVNAHPLSTLSVIYFAK